MVSNKNHLLQPFETRMEKVRVILSFNFRFLSAKGMPGSKSFILTFTLWYQILEVDWIPLKQAFETMRKLIF